MNAKIILIVGLLAGLVLLAGCTQESSSPPSGPVGGGCGFAAPAEDNDNGAACGLTSPAEDAGNLAKGTNEGAL